MVSRGPDWSVGEADQLVEIGGEPSGRWTKPFSIVAVGVALV
jgi:hypothetical protein